MIRFLHRRSNSATSLSDVRRLFYSVTAKDTVMWTAMVSAYIRSDQPSKSLGVLSQMLRHCCPNEYTYASAARAAGSLGNRKTSRVVHAQVVTRGFMANVIVGTSVVGMYSKCGDIVMARMVFDEMPVKSAVTWNCIISGYATAGMGVDALKIFYNMRCADHGEADEFTIASVLTGCAITGDLSSGMQIHGYFIKAGFQNDSPVANAVGNMYVRCGAVEFAEQAMEGREDDDEFSKLMMVKGYAFNGRYEDVIRSLRGGAFAKLISKDNSVFSSAIAACANLSLLKIGRQVHGFLVILGDEKDNNNKITAKSLIDMYFKCSCDADARSVFDCLDGGDKEASHWNSMVVGSIQNGSIEEAQRFFYDMPERNAVSWTAMISGYTRRGMGWRALELVSNLHEEIDCVSILTASLDACSSMSIISSGLDSGKQLHARAVKTTCSVSQSDRTIMLETALIDMYSKSSQLNYARRVFDGMGHCNVVSWTCMISGYASHGHGADALDLFEEFWNKGLKPNEVTLISILTACRHSGYVEQGMRYFKIITENCGVIPRGDHCACVVDMLARAGRLDEAWSLVEGIMDFGGRRRRRFEKKDCDAIWGALLNGCRLHGDMEMAEKLAVRITENNHQTSDTYVSLSNVYAGCERWDKVYQTRQEWKMSCNSTDDIQDPGHSRLESIISN